MAKLQLVAAPTFPATVQIPVAGGPSEPVVFTFKHRVRAALAEFQAGVADRADRDIVLDMASGWDLAEPFTPANVETLLDNRLGAGTAIYATYIDELTRHKAKN